MRRAAGPGTDCRIPKRPWAVIDIPTGRIGAHARLFLRDVVPVEMNMEVVGRFRKAGGGIFHHIGAIIHGNAIDPHGRGRRRGGGW